MKVYFRDGAAHEVDIDPDVLWGIWRGRQTGSLEARIKVQHHRRSLWLDVQYVDAARTFEEAIRGNFPTDPPANDTDLAPASGERRHSTMPSRR